MLRSLRSLTLGLAWALVLAMVVTSGCGAPVADGTGVDTGGGTVAPGTILGNWRVIKSIVGGAVSIPLDFSGDEISYNGTGAGLKDGDSVFEDWSIVEENGQFKLTSIYGSIYGAATADGAFFQYQGEDPRVSAWGVANVLQITIELHLSPNGEIYGGIVNQLYVANGIGMLQPAPPESWTFRGTAM